MVDNKKFQFEAKVLRQALLEWKLDPKLPMDRVLKNCFQEHNAGSIERRWIREAAFLGVKFWTAIFGLKLDLAKSRDLRDFEKQIQTLLKSLDGTGEKRGTGMRAEPDVSKATLRWEAKHRKLKPPYEQNPIEHLRQVHQVPESVLNAWNLSHVNVVDGLHDYLHASWRRPPLCIRANRLKNSRDNLLAALAGELGEGIKSSARLSTLSDQGILFDQSWPLVGTRLFEEGAFEVQDESSQIAVELLKPLLGTRVLDFCAGAGGKTLHLAELLSEHGEVWAYDVDKQKLKELKKRAERQGLDNVHILSSLPKKTEKFDLVLLDVPCSSLGNLRRNPDRLQKYGSWNKSSVQNELLLKGAQYVADGGSLVYATCTILPAENQEKVHMMSQPLKEQFGLSKGDLESVIRAALGSEKGNGFLRLASESYGGRLAGQPSGAQFTASAGKDLTPPESPHPKQGQPRFSLQWSFQAEQPGGHLSGALEGDGFFIALYNK